MKKIIKEIDKKFIISLFIIIAMLSTFMAYKIYAQEVTDSMVSTGTGMGNGVVGTKKYITLDDLRYKYQIFCCSKGTPLTGGVGATLVTELGSSDPEVTGKVKPGDEGKKLFETRLEGENTTTPFKAGTYTNSTYGNYTVSEVKVARPKEAYILAEMINNLPNETDAGFKFIGEDTGHKIEFTDTDSLQSSGYIVVGDKTIYIIESSAGSEKLVMQDTNGKYYYVEEGSNSGLGIYSYVQRAWWNTEAGSTGNDVIPNELTKEAELFEAYIKRIAKSMDTSTFTEQEYTINGVNGKVYAPEIEYNVDYNTGSVTEAGVTYDLDKPTVSWDAKEQVYKVGPFSINYVEEGAAVENRDAVMFSGITKAELYTDASNSPLELGKDWSFDWQKGQRTVEDTYEYPHENEIFYIKLKYIDGATRITDFNFDFKYMNAGGQYESLKGTYYNVTWTAKEKANWCTSGHKCSHGRISAHSWTTGTSPNTTTHTCDGGTACPHGKYCSHIESTDYWVELDSFSSPITSQLLAGGLIGARWYETASLHYETDLTQAGRIKVTKLIVDDDGNKINTLTDRKYFKFRITVGNETEIITVRAGGVGYSKLYTWKSNEKAPEYRVEEISTDGYELYDIKNESGRLNNGTVYVIAKNIKRNEGNLQIIKKVEDEALNGRNFDFIVKVTGTFKYDGKYYKNSTAEIRATVTAGSSWKSNSFVWFNDETPKYKIEEIAGADYEVKSITPRTGYLRTDETATVTAINRSVKEKAKIHMVKTLENADLFTEEYLKTLKFKFDIEVDGYGKNTVELEAKKENNSYIWEYTSDYYYWNKGTNPNYTITERDLPKGTEFGTANSSDTTISINGNKISGQLVSNKDKNFLVTNNIINKVITNQGKLKLTKNVNDDSMVNKEYKFKVKLTGTFEYKGNYYKDETVYLTNDSLIKESEANGTEFVTIAVGESKTAFWESDTFKWYADNNPEYDIEENLSGLSGVQATINPNKGNLDGTQTVNVIAENGLNKQKGSLHIIKTLENANNYSDEYVKSLKFKFHITVGTTDYGTVELEGKKVNNNYVWEYKSDYTWNEVEGAPTYTIEEVELPIGTEFVSANSPNGNATTEGKKITGTLKADSEENYTIVNNFINKLTTNSGYLKIEKKVIDESLKGKTFKFNVKISGTFEYNGTVYNNTVMTMENVEVSGGSTWTSKEIRWYGNNAPKYNIEEQESSYAEQVSVINSAGTLVAGATSEAQVATFTNQAKKFGGYLQITKKLEDGATSDEKFYFDITVKGYETYTVGIQAGSTYKSQIFTWDAGEEAPEYVIQERDSKYAKHISMTNGTETTTTGEISGKLKENEIINLICVNKLDKNSGKLKIIKQAIIDEKANQEDLDVEFTIKAVISGTFEMNGESIVESTRTITQTIKAGGSFESPEIYWYGEKAPTYTVSEISLPKGWTLENISNAEGQLETNTTVGVIVTNSLKSRVELELTMEMAGTVWEDTRVENKELEQTDVYGTQGIYDRELEQGIDGVEVYIEKVIYSGNTEVSRTLGTAYEDGTNTKIEFPLYTENGGYWSSPRMAVPALTEEEKNAGYTAAYDIEFVYDGQTYEPTDFLKTSNGDANAYRSKSTSERDKFANDSMALDYNREEVNNRIAEVSGDRAIDGEGNTIGKATGINGEENNIYYTSSDYSEGLSTSRKVSEIQTVNANGNVYDIYKTIAKTSVGGLTYPFDSRSHLESIDKYIDELGVVERYKYTATYNYTLNINLGLLRREEADIGTRKDLDSAKVVVNEKLLNYKFNTLADLTGSVISRQLNADEMNISYKLGLYSTDYYYRAEMYQTNGTVYDAVDTFYKSIGKNIESTELDVYLTYKINVYNESPSYVVSINSLNDYFDSSFGMPIQTTETKYVQTVDGTSLEGLTEVANKSYVETSNGKKLDVNWEVVESNIKGSDGVTYNKMVANFGKEDLKLASGEKAEFAVTFKVQKSNINGVKDAVILGQKSNVAEVASYSTYDSNGKIAGKIDKDSAPANLNIEEYNDRKWYEDDTDSAPILNLTLSEEERKIDGIAWEDKENTEVPDGKGQMVGNGIYDEGEALIGGLTTELIEKVMVKNPDSSTDYTEYDFLWPTNRPLDSLGGKTLKSLTGFDSTIETSRTQKVADDENGLDLGQYRFNGVPAGNYVVRFLYGNDKTQLEDTDGITGDAVALKIDGSGNVVNYSENEKLLTSNYDKDAEKRTPAVYNGQDFKSTAYQTGFESRDSEGYLNNEWHKLDIETGRISDARDSETKRLDVISKSETITNINGEVLASANDKDANHTDLYRNYYMYADTAKINMNVENILKNEKVGTETLKNDSIAKGVEVNFIKGEILTNGVLSTNLAEYVIKDIDLGIEERSETGIVLDKEISSIKLTTSDNKVIFNALYDIKYEEITPAEYALGKYTKIAEVNGKYLVAKVELQDSSVGIDVLQAINKIEDKDNRTGTKNFRYINVDDTILQGSTIEINYKLTALNVSETDRADKKLENIDQTAIANGTTVLEELEKAAREIEVANTSYKKPSGSLEFEKTTKVGSYLGTTYYQGANANNKDSVVTTTVRQLVDYVDNDAVFAATNNNGIDNSWRNATVNEITGNGYEAGRLLSKDIVTENNVIDKNGIAYITTQKNNIIVSIDNNKDDSALTNKGFEIKLLPYAADTSKYSALINLTTTRTVAAESDADSLAFDNLVEIVKLTNSVGRRDVTAIPGNANPRKGEFEISIDERDSSATELVTLTPPTGIETNSEMIVQILAASGVALVILAAGVFIIKKKVLTK